MTSTPQPFDEHLRRILTGVILLGGSSKRMGGRSKSLLMVGNKLLLARVADALRPVCAELIGVVRPGQEDSIPDTALALRMHVVEDEERDAGPLAGICAGLSATATPLCFVTGGDHPFLSRALIKAMVDRAFVRAEPIAVVPRFRGRLQPLHAVYPTRKWLEASRTAMAGGERSPSRLIDRCLASGSPQIHVMEESETAAHDLGLRSLVDVDTPAQLERARAMESWVTSVRRGLRPGGA